MVDPAPEPATDAVLRLAAIIREVDGSHMIGEVWLAPAILSHPTAREVFAAPTPPADGEAEARPQPVPVAQRPWEQPDWCDAEGRCWWLTLDQSWPCLYLMRPNSALATDSATYSLPHWAIPTPTEISNARANP